MVTLAAVLATQVQAQGAQDTRPGIAVLPFDFGGSINAGDPELPEALGVGVQQLLITEFAANPALRVVDRSQIRQLLAEQDLGGSGRVDANTAAKIGKLVGARYMVHGSVSEYGEFRIDARIISVETSEIVKTEKINGKRDGLYNLVTNLSNNITRGVNLPPLQRQAMEQRQNRSVPTEAVTFYSRALLYQDRGNQEKATELYNRALAIFPEYTEAQQGLQQLSAS
jgi:curli biogenesis system outer membrane secretion channel CsgG